MEDKLSINLNIADRYYPLKVERKDEEKIRKAAKMINDKVLQYKQRYTDKDVQDFLAMASLQFVTKVLEFESKTDVFPLIDALEEVNRDLEQYLSSKE